MLLDSELMGGRKFHEFSYDFPFKIVIDLISLVGKRTETIH